jgi:hypothetical protein
VVAKLGDGIARKKRWDALAPFLAALLRDALVTLVSVDADLTRRAIDLRNGRNDKDWGLTNCMSFVTMTEHGMHHALTADHHFQQAVFFCSAFGAVTFAAAFCTATTIVKYARSACSPVFVRLHDIGVPKAGDQFGFTVEARSRFLHPSVIDQSVDQLIVTAKRGGHNQLFRRPGSCCIRSVSAPY